MNIDLKKITEIVKPEGVVHVGANTCQELPMYAYYGFKRRIWIDGVNFSLEREWFINAFVSDSVGKKMFKHKASNNNESTSLLEPAKHLELYPEIEFSNVIMQTETTTIEAIFLNKLWVLENINYLVLDIQGMELMALKGLGLLKNHFEVIITEAYTDELYHNCGKLHQIEEYLTNYKLIEFAPEHNKGWGDAVFIRKDLIV